MTLYFAHSVISRLVRRLLQETKSPKSPANTLVFESLEPRLLLAADLLGVTAGDTAPVVTAPNLTPPHGQISIAASGHFTNRVVSLSVFD